MSSAALAAAPQPLQSMSPGGRRCLTCIGNHHMLVYLPCIGADVCPQCGTIYSGQAQHAAREDQPAPLLVMLRHIDTKLTCFISYGHDGLTQISRHLHKLLSARGHTVWFDEVSLAHGCDWQKEMEAGIRNALTAGDTGRFIVMLARHGFRRDVETSDAQGFCHREASLAYESMPQRCLALHLQDMQLPDCLAMANAYILDLRHMFTNRTDELSVDASQRGGGLTDAQWTYLLNSEPQVKRIMHNIVAAIETGCLNGAYFPPSLWKPAAASGRVPLTPAASPAPHTPNPSQEKPCRVFVSCDRYVAEIGALVAQRLTQAGYSVAFDKEYCELPLGDAAAEKARAAYVDEGVAWAAGKREHFGQYKLAEPSGDQVVAATDESGAALKPGKVVLLLTPEAVDRRKGDPRFGQCLDEFDRAFSLGLRFVPLMVTAGTQPPLAIVGLQWVAFWFGVENTTHACEVKTPHPQTIGGCLDSLVSGLREGLASEGQHSILLRRLQRRLRPLQNTSDFANFNQDFHVSSSSVTSAIDEWYARCTARVASDGVGGNALFLQGAARSGKTAFTVALSHKFRQGVFAAHFAGTTDVPSRSLQRASASLMYQAAAGNDTVAASLIENSFLETTFPVMSSQERLNKLLRDIPPSPDGKPRLLLVDSADLVVGKPSDAGAPGDAAQDSMASQLVEALRSAPAHVCAVITVTNMPTKAHNGLQALHARSGSAVASLSLQEPTVASELREAMHTSLMRQVSRLAGIEQSEQAPMPPPATPGSAAQDGLVPPPSAPTLASESTADPDSGRQVPAGTSPDPHQKQHMVEQAVRCIMERSQGSFEYCQLLLAELAAGGSLSLDKPDAFPPGLNALQALKLQREFPAEDFAKLQGPQLLGIVCAAEEPVGMCDLACMLDVAEEVVDAMVERTSALLQVHEGNVKERGAGTLQWLGQQTQPAGGASPQRGLSVDVLAGHKLLSVWAVRGVQRAQQASATDTSTQPRPFAATYAYRFLRRHLGFLQHAGAAASMPEFSALQQWLQQPAFLMEEHCQQVEEEGMSAFFHAFAGVQPAQLRAAAEAVLAAEPNGAFLLRNTSDGARGVSIVALNGHGQRVVEHKKVFPVLLPSEADAQLTALTLYRDALSFCQMWRQGDAYAQQGNTQAQQQLHAQAQQQFVSVLQQIPQGTPLEQVPQALLAQLQREASARDAPWQQCFAVYSMDVLASQVGASSDLSREVFVDLVSLVLHFIRAGQLVKPVKPAAVASAPTAAGVSISPSYVANAGMLASGGFELQRG